MRTKSPAKRQTIVDTAAATFAELGFDGTSMGEICARLGGSKATLYNYFPSKEALFMEVIFQATEADFENTMQALQGSRADVPTTLLGFGQQMLQLLYSTDVQALRRLLVAEGGRGNIGQHCWEQGPNRGNAVIAAYLQQAMDSGQLRRADVRLATRHLLVLLEAELLEPWMFHQTLPTGEALRDCAKRGVQAFWLLYGVAAAGEAVAAEVAAKPTKSKR